MGNRKMSERKKKYSTEHDENIPNNYQYQDESIQHSVPYYQNVRYDDRFQNNYHDEYNYRFNSYMEQPRYDPRYDSRPLHYSHEYAAYDRPGGMVNQEIIKSPVEEETSELESSLMKKTC